MENKQHVEALTWLRGIAALLVIFAHCLRASNVAYTSTDSPADARLFYAMDMGDLGVALFFSLSGLTLYLSNSSLSTISDTVGFYVKRFFRIWPAFAIALFTYVIFNTFFTALYTAPQGYWIEQHLRPFTFNNIFTYLTLISDFTGPRGLFNGAFWSLPVEFHFYIAFPLGLWIVSRIGSIGLLLLSTVFFAVAYFALFPMEDQSMWSMAPAFFGGMFIGVTTRHWQFRFPLTLSMLTIITLFAYESAIQNGILHLPDFPLLRGYNNMLIIISVITVFLVYRTDSSRVPIKIRRILHRYGEISYSTYLFHQLFIGASVLLFLHLGITGDIKPWFTLALTLPGTYAVASLSYRYIEQPSIALGRRLALRYS